MNLKSLIHSAPSLFGVSGGFQNQGQSGIARSGLCGQKVVFVYALDEATRIGNGQVIGMIKPPASIMNRMLPICA